MTANHVLQLATFVVLLTAFSIPLGMWLATLIQEPLGVPTKSHLNSFCTRIFGANALKEMNWKEYAFAVFIFSIISIIFLYLILRFQDVLPLNARGLAGMTPDLALNTSVSFVTNTNWQAYGGESSLSMFSQMIGLTVQNFVSAAVGLCIMAALFRGIKRRESATLGNFWTDLFRITIFYLLPLSLIVALSLVWQGIPQTFNESVSYQPIEVSFDEGFHGDTAQIAVGPVASQLAIKQLGTNGGGFYNANSAHPLENPTPLSNIIELLSILLIPAACCHALGIFMRDKRQGWSLYIAMLMVFVTFCTLSIYFEMHPNLGINANLVSIDATPFQSGGNMEGKEVRFGIAASSIWSVATTAASNGSVNAMHDSFTPLGGFFPLVMMQLSEVIFGGVGSGLYGMLSYVIVTVFLAGLMVGRTPEYLGKKIEAFEMKMVSLIVLIPCLLVLIGTAITVATSFGSTSVSNPGPHGFSQILYAYSSMGNNNGSAFGGFGSALPLHTLMGAFVMYISRYWIAIPVLALAGSLARKKSSPPSSGTLETHTPLFIILLLSVVIVVGALTFVPALILGPVVEHLL